MHVNACMHGLQVLFKIPLYFGFVLLPVAVSKQTYHLFRDRPALTSASSSTGPW